jgi:hypothetical protein
MKSNIGSADCTRVLFLAVVAGGLCQAAQAAQYQWDFGGDLNGTFGNGTLTYADASSQSLTTFGTTDGTTVPHIGGQPATYMYIPAFTALSEGYNAEFADTEPNGGGAYVNQYTMIFDILSTGPLNWTPFFNTNPDNPGGNDADFYLAYDGSLGIAALGYTDIDVVLPDTWYRIAFAADLAVNQVSFYVNGMPEFQTTGSGLLDGRFSLESNLDAGPDLRLFNVGYTCVQFLYVM